MNNFCLQTLYYPFRTITASLATHPRKEGIAPLATSHRKEYIQAMPAGRPTLKTDDTVAEIVERLANGEPLARICRDEHMPAFSTVWRWEEDDVEFRNLSARARRHGTHYMADDCIRISDDETLDPSDKKVRIDTRIRLIGKWNSKAYGDKVALTGGNEDDAPLKMISTAMSAKEAADAYRDELG